MRHKETQGGTEAAEHESQNENSARRPDRRIGSQRSRYALDWNGSRLYGMQYPPMSLHRDDPLIGDLDSRVCRISKKRSYTIVPLGM